MNEYNLAELAQTLFEESGDALFLFDPDTEQLIDVNPMAQRLSGYARQELLRMPVRYLFRSEVQGGLNRLRSAYQKTGLFHSQEGFLLRHQLDGVWIPVNLTVTRLHTDPKVLGLITARDVSDRRQAQQMLRKKEEQLREVLASVSDCLWSAEVGDQGTLVGRYCSPVAEHLTGFASDTFTGPTQWVEITHPDDRPHLQGALRNLLARTSDHEEVEVRISAPQLSIGLHPQVSIGLHPQVSIGLHQQGERWLRFSILAREDVERRCLVIDCVVSDVTERRRAAAAIRERDERFRAMVERGTEAIFLVDAEGTVRYASPSCVLLSGFTAEEVTGGPSLDFVLPEDLPAVQATSIEVMTRPEQPYQFLCRIRHRDGSIHHIEGQAINRLNDPSIRGVVVHARNVTARVRAEEAVRTSEARYRTLVDNLDQCVFLKDRELRFLAVNRRFCEELGRAEADILGKSDPDFYPTAVAEKYIWEDRAVLAGRRVEYEETHLLAGADQSTTRGTDHQHGGGVDQIRIVRVIKLPVLDDAGAVAGILGLLWDVTEAHRMEEQMRQTHKMNAIGQLAGGVAHDFNNLLTGILGNLSLVQAQVPAGTSIKEMLVTAEQAAWRAATLTSQLLGFSRRTILRVEPLLLNRTIDEVVALLSRTLDPRIDLHTSRAADLWTVQADPSQMSQVLMNLCINARDALLEVLNQRSEVRANTPAQAVGRLTSDLCGSAALLHGGESILGETTLRLETSNVSLDELAAARQHVTARAGEYVRLRVTDTGTGIPPDVLPRIFEPFFTTKGPDKGTGLGLAMVFGIVQQHHGWIECNSTVGQGTTFDIYLPRSTASPSSGGVVVPPLPPEGGTETILLADDEATLRSLGQMILRRHGYNVLLAEDGQRAVETYRRLQHEIALVILDLTMPRLSGQDALRQIRQINPGVRVMFTSGYSAEYLGEEEQRGIQGFIPKPFRPENLARLVREVLDGPGPANGLS
jgi:PAS domain S-box-containing protein